MSMVTLYFLVMLDSICNYLGCMIFLIILLCIVGLFFQGTRYDHACGDESRSKIASQTKSINFKIFLPLFIVISLLYTFIPTTKQVAFIYVAGKLTQNERIQSIGQNTINIPDKALQMLDLKMNEYLNEMKEEAVKETKKAVKEIKGETK